MDVTLVPWPARERGAKGRFGAFDGWQYEFDTLACKGKGTKGIFGIFDGWQMATLNTNKKLWMWPWYLGLQGKGCQRTIWSIWWLANGTLEHQQKAMELALVPWTSIKNYGCGIVALAWGVKGSKRTFEGFEAW